MNLGKESKMMAFLLAMLIIYLGSIEGVSARMQDPVLSLEGRTVRLTIELPSKSEINSSLVTIALDRHDSGGLTDVLYITGVKGDNLKPQTKDTYESRINVTPPVSGSRTLVFMLRDVGVGDAGTFKCYPGAQTLNELSGCGQPLFIIRKPDPPSIEMLPSSSLLEGEDLTLECITNSRSLPPDHGLSSEIWWYDAQGTYVGLGGNPKISINSQSQLVVENIDRTDTGRTFTCTSADNANDVAKRVVSDKSVAYTVIPEFEPKRQDMTVLPEFTQGDVIQKKLGEQIRYTCTAACSPTCDVVWKFKSLNSSSFGEIGNLVEKHILTRDVQNVYEGTYRCVASNTHGQAYQSFTLEALYLNSPVVSIDGVTVDRASVVENSNVELKCVFDSNPSPTVSWFAPDGAVLFTGPASGPDKIQADNGVLKRLYTSTYTLHDVMCESSGEYMCRGNNGAQHDVESRMDLTVMCPPSSADIEGLELQSEYVWEIPHAISINFVIRALPKPRISRIMSRLNGQSRQELIPQDMDVAVQEAYDGKPYLTKFTIESRRNLDLSDMNRVFTLYMESTEFNKDFEFTIRPRGPPHEVKNLTVSEIKHSSVLLHWQPGFNGGEVQIFNVEHRRQSQRETETGELQAGEQEWTLAVENVADVSPEEWINEKVGSLSASTNYFLRVVAYNHLGNSTTVIPIKTAASPDDSLGAGAIVGIFFAVVIILAIVALVLYCFVLPIIRGKKEGDDEERAGTRKPMIPEAIVAVFRRGKDKNKEDANGTGVNEGPPKEGVMMRMKNLWKKKSSRTSSEYDQVPPREDSDADDSTFDDDDDVDDGNYVNTDMKKKPEGASDENIYVNEVPLNNNARAAKDPENTVKLAFVLLVGHSTQDDKGLVYSQIDFSDKQKKNPKGKDKKKGKKEKKKEGEENNRVDYSDIDFEKTRQLREEKEAAEREAAEREEEARRKEAEEAADGGADYENVEEKDGNVSKGDRIVDEGIGTRV